jgi:hypothetical protein
MSMYASFARAEAAYRRERIAADFRPRPAGPSRRDRSGRSLLGWLHRRRAVGAPRTAGVTVGSGRLVH